LPSDITAFIQDKEYFEEAMENGYVECTMTTCAVTGAAGSGKSCTMYLVLNEDPPDLRQSTGLVEPVRALSTVVGAAESGSSEWSRVDEDKLLGVVVEATSVTSAEEQPAVPTIEETTAKETTTEESTTKENTTEEFTKEETTTSESTMEKSTTEESTTEESSSTPLITPKDKCNREQPDSSSKTGISEQVSKLEQASQTEVVDELLT